MFAKLKFKFVIFLVIVLADIISNQNANAEWHWTKYEKWNCCEIPSWLNSKGMFNHNLEQSNECENSECINGGNEITGKGNADSQQTIIQSNRCISGATCINSAGNVYLIGNPSGVG